MFQSETTREGAGQKRLYLTLRTVLAVVLVGVAIASAALAGMP
jgi:hypothetical protein